MDPALEVAQFVRVVGAPNVLSLSDDCHLFHFHMDDWRLSPVIFVNRNGNHMRLIRDGHAWVCVKTWNTMFQVDDWMNAFVETDLNRALAKITPGFQFGEFESLCLLPKDAFAPGQRRAVWRSMILRVRFDMDNDCFSLASHNAVSSWIKGKPWKNKEASDWCAAQNFPAVVSTMDPQVTDDPQARRQAQEAEMMALESNPLFGAFG